MLINIAGMKSKVA